MDSFLVGVLFWFADGCLHAVPSHGRKIISLVSFLIRALIPFLGLHLHVLITSQRPQLKYFHIGL